MILSNELPYLRSSTERIIVQFSQAMSLEDMKLQSAPVDDFLKKLLADFAEPMRQRLEAEFFDCGPISKLLFDLKVTEIIINGGRQIWYEREAQWQKLEDEFLSPSTFRNWVHRISNEAGMVFDLNQPFANGRWRDFRVHVACQPLVHCEFHVSLRRQSVEPWSLAKLEELGWADRRSADLLSTIIKSEANILFVGTTGSGKTSVLSASLNEIEPNQRAILIEDTDELPIPNSCSTKMLSRDGTGDGLKSFDLSDLVKQSLRMRPHRIVIGEIRGGEAKDLLLALATGHRGSFGTMHAETAPQALLRLEMLVQIGAPQWSLQTIRQLIALSLNYIVVCGFANGQRVLGGIYKLAALESCGFLLEPVADHP